jgi:hypothetical protein
MTRKKKTMEGGIFGYIPNQPKYRPETVTNDTFNELVTKLTRDQSVLNKLRVEQRFTHFLNILDYKLKQDNIDEEKFKKLYEYFMKIYNKYKDNLSGILRSNHQLFNKIKKLFDIYNVNKFIIKYINNQKNNQNTKSNLNLDDLKSKLLFIINSAKEETDFKKFNELKDKYFYLLTIYKHVFSKNKNNFLNTSINSFQQLEQNKFPRIFQPSQ